MRQLAADHSFARSSESPHPLLLGTNPLRTDSKKSADEPTELRSLAPEQISLRCRCLPCRAHRKVFPSSFSSRLSVGAAHDRWLPGAFRFFRVCGDGRRRVRSSYAGAEGSSGQPPVNGEGEVLGEVYVADGSRSIDEIQPTRVETIRRLHTQTVIAEPGPPLG